VLKGKQKEEINVLGIITPHDVDMHAQGQVGHLLRLDSMHRQPQQYDLTSCVPERCATPPPGSQVTVEDV
jgi:hypothetical protein